MDKKNTLYFRLKKYEVSTLDYNKGFINLIFLLKMNCQKTDWDQARFSSLVYRFVLACEWFYSYPKIDTILYLYCDERRDID